MKHVVLQSDLHGSDIRPTELFSRFFELSIEDARLFFGAAEQMTETACPACASEAAGPVFEKHGFGYMECRACATVYVSPRPTADALRGYYRDSRAVHFRAEQFIRATGEARRFHILRQHALWLGRIVDERRRHREPADYADIGTIYPMLFDEIGSLKLFDQRYCFDALDRIGAACVEHGAQIAATPPEGLAAVTAFEQLEHQFSPAELLGLIHSMLEPGGLAFLTTRTISGFDLQMLWDRAPYIYVPEHLNLMSIEGLERLFARAGFHVIELSTPGQLDVELTRQAVADDPSIPLPRFFSYMLERRGEDTLAEFQAFLQKNRLSSHIRVAAQKI